MAVRAHRGRMVAASVLAAMAIAAPSAAAADTTPPSAPTSAASEFDNCFFAYFVHWRPSSDNVDAPGDLRYRMYDTDGRLMPGYGGVTNWEGVPSGDDLWILFEQKRPHTIRAVDRSGNLSAATVVKQS